MKIYVILNFILLVYYIVLGDQSGVFQSYELGIYNLQDCVYTGNDNSTLKMSSSVGKC